MRPPAPPHVSNATHEYQFETMYLDMASPLVWSGAYLTLLPIYGSRHPVAMQLHIELALYPRFGFKPQPPRVLPEGPHPAPGLRPKSQGLPDSRGTRLKTPVGLRNCKQSLPVELPRIVQDWWPHQKTTFPTTDRKTKFKQRKKQQKQQKLAASPYIKDCPGKISQPFKG